MFQFERKEAKLYKAINPMKKQKKNSNNQQPLIGIQPTKSNLASTNNSPVREKVKNLNIGQAKEQKYQVSKPRNVLGPNHLGISYH